MCAVRTEILAGDFPNEISACLVSSVEAVLDTLLDTKGINYRIAEKELVTALRERLPYGHSVAETVRVVGNARFTHDWVLGCESAIVACELERTANRIEFDILKFQAFASRQQREPVTYGCLILRADRVLPRHVTGGSEQASSYLRRLRPLIAAQCDGPLRGVAAVLYP